ncbi:MAG: hypothetical protein ACK47B_15810 [Armatimonadota bacterium]
MGTLISTSVWTTEEDSPAVFRALCLGLHGPYEPSLEIDDDRIGFSPSRPKGPGRHGPLPSRYTPLELADCADPDRWRRLLAQLTRDQIVRARGAIVLQSGLEITCDLALSRWDFGMGYRVRDGAFVQGGVMYKDLARELIDAGVYQGRSGPKIVRLRRELLENSREVFQRLAVVPEASGLGHLAPHAGMYLEYGCPSGPFCSQVFHRDYREIVRDLLRAYEEYHRGIFAYDAYTPGADLASLPNSDNPVREHNYFISQFGAPDARNIREFMDSIQPERLARLAELPPERIEEWLILADHAEYGAAFELVEGGFILSTDPMESLWRLYQAFYQAHT